MNITLEQKAHVIDLLRKKYADWDGFDHQAFRRDEINFKRSTVKKAVSLLGESTLAQLLVTRDTDAFIDRLSRIGQATPLLQRDGSVNGDLEILHVSTLDKPVFCAQVYHLLHGTESVIDRLDAYFHYIEDHELPNTWTFPTYLLQFCYPDTEIFVAPRPTEWFLKYIGMAPSLGRPSSETYASIKGFAHGLKRIMADFRPRDMIDIQSVIHVSSMMSGPGSRGANGQSGDETYGYGSNTFGLDSYGTGTGEQFWADSQMIGGDTTMPSIPGFGETSNAQLSGMIDETASRNIEPPPEVEYPELSKAFKNFIKAYMSSPAGVSRAAAYAKAREQAEQNFSQLIAEHELGEVVTDRIFLHLLPHSDSKNNNLLGAWIHPGPSAEDMIERLDEKYGSDSSVRQQVAQVLLEFIRHCVYKANALEKSTEALERIDAISLIDVGSITPILHALKPMQYVLLNEASIGIINHFTESTFEARLQKLPELNAAGLQLVESLRRQALMAHYQSVQPTDLFDIFCTWYTEQESGTAGEHSHGDSMPGIYPPLHSPGELTGQGNGSAAVGYPQAHRGVESAPPPRYIHRSASAWNEAYTAVECSHDTGVPVEVLERWYSALTRKGQMIFFGPAGSGKTFIASKFARSIVSNSDGLFDTIQFHPEYTYEDFIGDPRLQSGFFRSFCAEAAQRTGPCVLLIDEINRVDLVKVFGELLYQLEYRDPEQQLANYNAFSIPNNVYVVGTMKPRRDASLLFDPVVRRRFALVCIEPDFEILKQYHEETDFQVEGLIRTVVQLNERIEDPAMRIGVSYFLIPDLAEHIEDIWKYEVEPCIEAAFPDEPEHVDSFKWDKIKRRLTR